MMSTRLRTALAAFAMTILVAGPVVAVLVLLYAISQDPSARAIGVALSNVIELIVTSVLGGGVLRALTSIDARLEQRA